MRKTLLLLVCTFLLVLIVLQWPPNIVEAQAKNSDINGDGIVDVFDALILLSAYKSKPYASNWNPNADLNIDGVIDIFDALILSSDYGLGSPVREQSEIRCLEWYREYSFSSTEASDSLKELKAKIPDCNYLQVKCFVGVRGDTVAALTGTSSLGYAITTARQFGYKIILRVIMLDASVFMPSDVAAWFDSFTIAVKQYAVFAETHGVEGFCFGAEFTRLEGSEYDGAWRDLISQLREVYSGRLWYQTNWWWLKTGELNSLEQKLSTQWFSALDCIAVSAYWELANATDPSVGELVNNWHNFRSVQEASGLQKPWLVEDVVEDLRTLSSTFDKRVLIVSGIASADGACMTPWAYGDYYSNVGASIGEQRNWYEALFEVFHGQNWVLGFEFDGAWSTTPNHPMTKEFLIQGKPAQQIVNIWFGK